MLKSLLILPLAASSLAQFVNYDRNLTVVTAPGGDNVTVSYKEPTGVCKTAFAQQKQYTGWANVPGDFPTNLFFWFVEAREPSQKLTIWLNGGPGSSSLFGFFAGNGPCQVIEKSRTQLETAATEWGWDRSSNMLFIDQPNQVGFSYDTPTNGTNSLLQETYLFPPTHVRPSDIPWTIINGTFSTQQGSNTVNTTQVAAHAVWHMLQGFLDAFPQYKPTASNSVGVSLFAESYGGRYGPVFADVWEEQNDRRKNGQLDANTTVDINLVSLGIVNGCIDQEVQVPFYPVFANRNTYGVKVLSDEEAKFYSDKFSASGGCQDQLRTCVQAAESSDPNDTGAVALVNNYCANASDTCFQIEAPYYDSQRSPYDLASPYLDPTPPVTFIDYLNRGEVIQAIGSPINYTMTSQPVFTQFGKTGDIARGRTISRLADLLNRGIRVGLMYGDRDYICNWMGGEAVSLQVAAQAGGQYGQKFRSAGYTPIAVNNSYVGGEVRQYGNLSFSRIYQAGHSVAWYQPETAFQVFSRIMMGKSVATGQDIDVNTFGTTGNANSTATAKLPPSPSTTCWVRAFQETCDNVAVMALRSGKGVVINGVLYASESDWPGANKTDGGSPTKTSSTQSSPTLTGVFTATSSPKHDAATSMRPALITVLSLSAMSLLMIQM